ncbi:MAG: alpha/beta hydrolase [Cytophagaceae bacterium]|nr:alpha/beta hydrolase [Gemmatimonadaceae bacterium]
MLGVASCGRGTYTQSDSATGEVSVMANPSPPEVSSSAASPRAAPTPAMARVLDELASLGGKPIETLTPEEARRQPTPTDAVTAVLTKEGRSTDPTDLVPGVASADRTIPGAAGQIPARVYTPAGAGPFPVIVYYHGGGFVIANKDVYDGGARGLSKLANAVVISIDYRLAPEHKFPAAHDDALAAYRWTLANAASINGDPTRVALAGESAGGNLALATAIAARDQQLQAPMHILAVYPVAATDTTTPSYIENANAKPLNRAMMGWFVKHATASAQDLKDPRLDLINANLAGLPPVTIVAAEIDPLRSEGETLMERLRAAGVDVSRRQWNGMAHEFFGMAAVLDAAKEAQKYAADRLRGSLSGASAAGKGAPAGPGSIPTR